MGPPCGRDGQTPGGPGRGHVAQSCPREPAARRCARTRRLRWRTCPSRGADGLWRSLVSALRSGRRGPRFKSGQPDSRGFCLGVGGRTMVPGQLKESGNVAGLSTWGVSSGVPELRRLQLEFRARHDQFLRWGQPETLKEIEQLAVHFTQTYYPVRTRNSMRCVNAAVNVRLIPDARGSISFRNGCVGGCGDFSRR